MKLARIASRRRVAPSSSLRNRRRPHDQPIEAMERRVLMTGDPFPAYVDPASVGTYDLATNTLTFTGTAAITADPGAANAPNVNVAGSTARLTINSFPARRYTSRV
jgi:hypothetical protein